VARANGDPFSIADAVRQTIRDVDPELPISRMYTMREVLETSVSQRRFQMLLTSTFAVCALLLAALGVYGVISHAVTRRTREIGIRMAFGAQPANVYSMVLQQGARPVALGLIAGMAGAYGLTRFLRSLLYEVSSNDPLTVCVVVVLMAVVALVACYLPARRAARLDPMQVLRCE
jgi:putative ABC transport system permease protein